MPKTIVAIVGSYRKAGVIDTAVDEMLRAAQDCGVQTSKIYLIDKHIEFCTNCRACAQNPGKVRGNCRHNDDMASILDQVDFADGLVIASPVNFYNITAVTRRFMERLIVYGYWPWGSVAPKFRIAKSGKKAVLVTSSAAPAFIGKFFFRPAVTALKAIAQCFGAKVVARIYFGMVAQQPDATLNQKDLARAYNAGIKLANSV
ncbi:MAG: flavodoxin family protein [Sedimentisphaerales bacterium]|jgi:multimeric flavodoxin WrbA